MQSLVIFVRFSGIFPMWENKGSKNLARKKVDFSQLPQSAENTENKTIRSQEYNFSCYERNHYHIQFTSSFAAATILKCSAVRDWEPT